MALGMQSGSIPDQAISASSAYVPNVGAKNARFALFFLFFENFIVQKSRSLVPNGPLATVVRYMPVTAHFYKNHNEDYTG